MRYFLVCLISAIAAVSSAQSPHLISYQFVLRDQLGELLSNDIVNIRFTIQNGNLEASPVLYSEEQNLVTNEFGLVNCFIGNGTALTGVITDVDWNTGERYLKVEANLGLGYELMGIQQMVSVPFALSALTAVDAINSWSAEGNSNMNSANNFIGTVDTPTLAFRVNNKKAGLIDEQKETVFWGSEAGLNNSGIKNVYVGDGAGKLSTTGDNNVFIGNDAGSTITTGDMNVMVGSGTGILNANASANAVVGYGALSSSPDGNSGSNAVLGTFALANGGNQCVAIGTYAGVQSTAIAGIGGVYVGYGAGFSNAVGEGCVFVGYEAGYNNGDNINYEFPGGEANTFIGFQSGYSNIGSYLNESGSHNTFLGYRSGFYNSGADFDGRYNTFLGSYSGHNNEVGSNNTYVGKSSGYSNTDGGANTFVGLEAGYSNTSADRNTFIGMNAGRQTNTGSNNTFMGFSAGHFNNTGTDNVFVGMNAGRTNNAGVDNVFIGVDAGTENNAGNANTFVGNNAGYVNSSGADNTFIGAQAGLDNTIGIENTFVGTNAGYNNLSGNHNTSIGFDAGGSQTTGGDCTFLGYSAECSVGTFTNSTAIGYQASVTSSNRVRIGNSAITQIGGQVGWSTLSDARLKSNVQKSNLGLEFILKLNPVTYNYNNENSGITYSGFLAQDVQTILDGMNVSFSGITLPENETDFYSIRYAEFVVPLVKAVQEQNMELIELRAKNKELEDKLSKVDELEAELNRIKMWLKTGEQ